jgi:ABC-type multidrug transport system ATPase subunit
VATIFQVEQLTKIYPKAKRPANDGLTFTIEQGEVFGLLGPNGAGKSTLVGQLAGLIRPTSGSIHLFGIDVVRHPEAVAEYVSIQPQTSLALWDLTATEAIYQTGRLRGMTQAAARRQTLDLIEELGMVAFADRPVRRLSGGQRRLVLLGVAFIGDRPVQIFDEPTNDLDPEARRRVWDRLTRLSRTGTTIILVTHNVLEAEQVIGRVGIVNEGRLLALGTPGELKARVDQRVRLDLAPKGDPQAIGPLLSDLGEAIAMPGGRWTVYCDRAATRRTIDQVLARLTIDGLDDFRILTPSLEDVYMELSGGAQLG